MLGVDSHNDSAFMSESVFDCCKGHDLVQTRSHAYKKNDQTWVEQKNGSIVREACAKRARMPARNQAARDTGTESRATMTV